MAMIEGRRGPCSWRRPWRITENRFEPDRSRYAESIFAQCNGYLGLRGVLEERCGVDADVVTFVQGVFDELPGTLDELVNLPSPLPMRIVLAGERFDLREGVARSHRRVYDLRDGVLTRTVTWEDRKGRVTRLRFRRFVSLADSHLVVCRTEIEPVNYGGEISVACSIDARPDNWGVSHHAEISSGAVADNGYRMAVRTKQSKVTVAESAALSLTRDGQPVNARSRLKRAKRQVGRTLTWRARKGETYVLDRVAAIVTSRDGLRGSPAKRAAIMAADALARGFDSLYRDQRAAWRAKWRDADVVIEGDPIPQNALRFSIYHLIQANAEHDGRVAIGAKALSGLGYRGHFFWDTEVFMLPMFMFTNPPAARSLLAYRWHSLPGARAKAREYGYRGAMFPWEGTLDGSEQCPQWVGPGRVWCGEKQHHVVADVAWGVWSYYQATGDVQFMLDYGLELLIECARFWASRPRLNRKTGCYEIHDVIGPDEYQEGINNNAYTNYMAAWMLRAADRALAALGRRKGAVEVTRRLRLRSDERPRWRRIAGKMKFVHDQRTGFIVQHDGFPDLLAVGRKRPAEGGHDSPPVLKQADVLMLMRIFPRRFPKRAVRVNWDYYEPLTDHGSSLSRGVHAVVAADLGLTRKALGYFADACQLDLIDRNGNTSDGVHAAALGNAWIGAVRGFGGMVVDDDGALSIDPALPARWRGLRYRVHYRGGVLSVDIGPRRVSLRYDHPNGNDLGLRVQGGKAILRSGENRTLALRR